MKAISSPVWVIAEKSNEKIHAVSYQLIGKARKLAEELDSTVEVILLGEKAGNHTDELIAAGADCVFVGESPKLKLFQSESYCNLIVDLAKERHPEIILLGSTSMGRELAPLIAARLKTGLTAHCIDLVLNDEKILEQKIPAYGGLLTIVCPEKRPQMATVASGVFTEPEMDENKVGTVVSLDVTNVDCRRVQTLEIFQEEPKGAPLESAAIVVAGGAGAGTEDGWNLISDLASELNAALGCTRPAADEGWIDLNAMIGQSGKMVSPDCYIGVGLSGELQHMVGISGAKIMIAINNDSKSPVFNQVDYGVVDDCRQFVPVLIEKIKKRKDSI